MTIKTWWESKGIDWDSVEMLIDMYPEDHAVSNAAKELLQCLTDYSFEEIVYETQ